MPINNYLRTKNLFDKFGQPQDPFDNVQFGPAQQPDYNIPPPPPPDEPPQQVDPIQRYKELIDKINIPETENTDRFNRLLDEAPEMEEPSTLRKIAAAGAYLGNVRRNIPGGFKAAEEVRNAPYNREMADWKDKAQPYYNAANLERQSNIQDRTLTSNVITAQTQADKLAENARQADQKNEIAQKRADNDAIRARAYAAKNDGWKVIQAGTRIVAVKPETGQRVDLGDSGKLDEETRLDILGEWGVKQAEARVTTAATRAQARDPRDERNDRFRAALDKNPQLAKWVSVPTTVNGDYQLKAPPTLGRYLTRNSIEDQQIAEYNELLKAIDPNSTPIPSRNAPSGDIVIPASRPDTKPQVAAPNRSGVETTIRGVEPGRVIIVAPDGKTKFTLPANQVDDYIRENPGFKRVQ